MITHAYMSPIKNQRQECIVYSRVVGWYTPTKNFNPGKASEYNDRKTFKMKNDN
jgi:hypothetical protein